MGRPNVFLLIDICTHWTLYWDFRAVSILKEDNISGDSGWCPRHGGCHDKTFAVTKKNETGPWLDPHTTWYVYIPMSSYYLFPIL